MADLFAIGVWHELGIEVKTSRNIGHRPQQPGI
jgi:hypothetical protein